MNSLLNLVMAIITPFLAAPPTASPNAPTLVAQAPKVPQKATPPAAKPPQSVPVPVEQDPTARVLAGIQAYYAGAADLKAKFTQHYTYKVYDRTQVSSGKVFFKKPRMMRWDYQKPASKVFVADGKTLWVYEPEEGQVFKRDLVGSQLPVALTFMSGEGDLTKAFDATLTDESKADFVLELVPKESAADYQKLLLSVDRSTFQVRESTVIDPVGNVNRVVFTDIKTNSGLPDRGFQFTPPEGVRVIAEPGR